MSNCERYPSRWETSACSGTTVDGDRLCWECLPKLRHVLLSLQEMVDELQTQITKQDVGARGVGSGGSHEAPLPFDIHSSEALGHIASVLGKWCAPYAIEHIPLQGLTTERRVRVLIHWHLRNYVRTGRINGPDMLADFDEALSKAVRSVDRKTSKVWIGNCECGRPVRAFPHQRDLVECECGQLYDPAQSRRDMRVLGGQQIVTARQAEQLGEVFGKTIKRSTVSQWQRRGKIECRNEPCLDCSPHTYLMSDILTLHKEN